MQTVMQRRNISAGGATLWPTEIDRIAIGHALVDNCSASQACAAIIRHARTKGRPAYVTTANAQHIVLLDRDARFRMIYRQADLIVPDGASLLLAARLYGRPLQERVTGVDMFCTLCGLAAKEGLHVFLLGGRPGSADLAGALLKKQHPTLRLSTYCPPMGFEKSPTGLRDTAQAIRAAKPDLLFVALGAPKQEYWIYEHGLELSVPVSIGVGGTFELVAGLLPRAPQWMQNLGCEWVYRLYLEPRRMWRRYLIGNLEFAAIVGRQCMRRAFLDAFFALVNKGSFAAEIHEAELRRKFEIASQVIEISSGDPEELTESHRSGAVAS
jgi:N-acetylglucosaminyldiphosphoundecaprenol N-acetyl-beta-D-mannosaminyltransferase